MTVLQARDDRIAELSRAALAHNAALKGLRDTYESRVLEIKRENASQLLSMRKELVVTRGQVRCFEAPSSTVSASTQL
jgi:hypothetical protein